MSCIKVGGRCCDTGSLNLSSSVETVATGPAESWKFRRADIEALRDRLEGLGHKVKLLPFVAELSLLDCLVDQPPFDAGFHLKLPYGGFIATSFGLVIERGV